MGSDEMKIKRCCQRMMPDTGVRMCVGNKDPSSCSSSFSAKSCGLAQLASASPSEAKYSVKILECHPLIFKTSNFLVRSVLHFLVRYAQEIEPFSRDAEFD